MQKMFKESGRTAVFTTTFVIYENKDITTVYHYEEDGAWQFSSSDEFENYEDVARIICLEEMVNIDNTLLEIADLPEGYMAFRIKKNEEWFFKKI